MTPVPVLMYHHVNPHRGDTVTVAPDVFAGQMRHLADNGYRTLTLDELMLYIRGELTLSGKAVVLTFDDGWLDNHIYAYPVLKEYGMKAAMFLIVERIEKASKNGRRPPPAIPGHEESKQMIAGGHADRVVMDWRTVREMRDEGLVSFYSHTMTHRKCDTLAAGELAEELAVSKNVIEKRLGGPCPYLCWPYGAHGPFSSEAAREAGYIAAFTTIDGAVEAGSDPFEIRRVDVKGDLSWFEAKLASFAGISASAAKS